VTLVFAHLEDLEGRAISAALFEPSAVALVRARGNATAGFAALVDGIAEFGRAAVVDVLPAKPAGRAGEEFR
jgi:hypothetical protein